MSVIGFGRTTLAWFELGAVAEWIFSAFYAVYATRSPIIRLWRFVAFTRMLWQACFTEVLALCAKAGIVNVG
jgi:hypothetical protein